MNKTAAATLALLLTTSLAFAGDVLRRGAAIAADAKAVSLAEVVEKTTELEKKTVVVEGTISRVCTTKGCWMQIADDEGKSTIRVTFKDYAFFVPTDSKGLKVRAEGTARVRTMSKKEVDHLAGEDLAVTRNADGTAREVNFVANGIEITLK